MSTSVVLSVGSNCSSDYVSDAIKWLSTHIEYFIASDMYKTPSIHGYGDPYVNAVAMGETELEQEEFNRTLKQYEIKCGRDESCRAAGIVPIDIDIVMWNNEVIRYRDYRHEFFQIGFRQLLKSEKIM